MTELYISIGAGVLALVVAAFLFKNGYQPIGRWASGLKRLGP